LFCREGEIPPIQEGKFSHPLSIGELLLFFNEWNFRARTYPHFDHVINRASEARSLIEKFQQTGKHSFLPFIEEPIELRRFSKFLEKMQMIDEGEGEDVHNCIVNKPRPIKYASHQDSQIFSYYRFIVHSRYEILLAEKELSDFPIAYRKIPVRDGSKKGKCNIHFAKEAFDEIVSRGNCVAITFDIEKFFESLGRVDIWR